MAMVVALDELEFDVFVRAQNGLEELKLSRFGGI